MKGSFLMRIILGCSFAVLLASGAEGRTLTEAANRSAVLPSDGSGWNRVALGFDLSGLREGAIPSVAWAYLEWTLPNLDGESASEFYVHEITGAWSPTSVASGTASVTYAEAPLDEWDVTSWSYDHVGGLVRLDVTGLVREWMANSTFDHGLLVATRNVSSQTMSSGAGQIRLVVGFRH